MVSFQNATGTLPTRNYNEGQFEGFEPIRGEVMTETILVERDTCYACTVHCKRVVETRMEGPAGRAASTAAPNTKPWPPSAPTAASTTWHAVSYANKLCNEYGLDTIGTGATIAWAMECYENGLLTEAEVGFPLQFGDAEAMVRATEMLGHARRLRQRPGRRLAQAPPTGSKRATTT